MDIQELSIGLDGIEMEIQSLREELRKLGTNVSNPVKIPHFADLRGVWKGKVNLSFEEIASAKYRAKVSPSH